MPWRKMRLLTNPFSHPQFGENGARMGVATTPAMFGNDFERLKHIWRGGNKGDVGGLVFVFLVNRLEHAARLDGGTGAHRSSQIST